MRKIRERDPSQNPPPLPVATKVTATHPVLLELFNVEGGAFDALMRRAILEAVKDVLNQRLRVGRRQNLQEEDLMAAAGATVTAVIPWGGRRKMQRS